MGANLQNSNGLDLRSCGSLKPKSNQALHTVDLYHCSTPLLNPESAWTEPKKKKKKTVKMICQGMVPFLTYYWSQQASSFRWNSSPVFVNATESLKGFARGSHLKDWRCGGAAGRPDSTPWASPFHLHSHPPPCWENKSDSSIFYQPAHSVTSLISCGYAHFNTRGSGCTKGPSPVTQPALSQVGQASQVIFVTPGRSAIITWSS